MAAEKGDKIDQAEGAKEQLIVLHAGSWARSVARAWPNVNGGLQNRLTVGPEGIFQGEEASELVAAMRSRFIVEATAELSRMGGAEWLTSLRRMRVTDVMLMANVVFEDAQEMLLVAENLAGTSTASAREALPRHTAACSTARFLGWAWLIVRSEQIWRSINKGMTLFVDALGSPRTDGPRALREAIIDFDFRQRWYSPLQWEPRLNGRPELQIEGMPTSVMVYRRYPLPSFR